MEILNQGFDHVEYIVHDVESFGSVFQRLGFEKIGQRVLNEQGTRSVAYGQGHLRIIMTQAEAETAAFPAASTKALAKASERSEALKFLKNQAEGICVLAVEVADARAAYAETVQRGARPALAPKVFKSQKGTVIRSEIWTPGNVRYAFIERHSVSGGKAAENAPALLDDSLEVSHLVSPSPLGIQHIDHLTNNVGMGEMKDWVKYYKDIFGFIVTRHFDIRTARTGLLSEVVESPDHRVKVPINEATDPQSQIQEFVHRMKGTGVQHLALRTSDIQHTLKGLREAGFKFLSVPHTYYEDVPKRVPGVTENLQDLEDLGILLDGDETGYLLQIFSEEILGPFFFEFIQRKGRHEGFGEGNFRALFEAIERDQIRRGVLKE